MRATVSFRCYRRRFVRPLNTAHGPWRDRRGLILKVQTSDGKSAYGEVAPIPWFGSETLDEAIALLQTLAELQLSQTVSELIPAHYPATRFGLGLALAQLDQQLAFAPLAFAPLEFAPLEFAANHRYDNPASICALLPTGVAALEAWPALWEQGHRTFKWKLGLADLAEEMTLLEQLRRSLPTTAQLRLDANTAWTVAEARICLAQCDRLAAQGLPLEFLEQPLPPGQFSELLALSRAYQTPLALDESVATLPQLKSCYERGWRGIFVIKGAIAGDPMDLLAFCQTHQLDVVWSAVFETQIARQGVMAMASTLEAAAGDGELNSSPSRALGFGVQHWFSPDPTQDPLGQLNGEALWQQLSTG